MRLQGVEIQRNISQVRRQDAAGGTSGQVRVQGVTILHAAAVLVYQFAQRNTGWRELDAGVLHPAADAERAQALAPVAAKSAEPGSALFDDVAYPVQGLEIVFQRGPPEQSDLRDIRGAHTRLAAFAFDALDHRRLFATDIGTRAAPQFDQRQLARRIGPQGRQFGLQNRTATVVFVAQVDVARVGAHHLRRDQHTLQKTVRIALQPGPVLESSGFALVDIYRHDARCRLLAHDAPFAPGRESCAAKAAQSGMLHRLNDAFCFVLAVDQRRSQCISAIRAVSHITRVGRRYRSQGRFRRQALLCKFCRGERLRQRRVRVSRLA